MAVYRTENALVLWQIDPESTKTDGVYGKINTSGTDNNSKPRFRFGLHETVQAPDPEVEWTPFYGPGSDRSRQTILAGKWTLRGSVPDIRVQPGCVASDAKIDGSVAELLTLVLGRYKEENTFTDGTKTSISGWTIKENRDPISRTIPNPSVTNYDGRLPFFTMQIAATNTEGGHWIRNYYGGKVGRATLSASEGEDLRLSLEEIIFKDIRTNKPNVTSTTPQDIRDGLLGNSSIDIYSNESTPKTYDPLSSNGRYLFAGATIDFNGITLARVKRFNLSIDNQLEPKYYMSKKLLKVNGGASSSTSDDNLGHQVISEIVEGKRSYSLDLDLDFVDYDSDFKLFSYLINTDGVGRTSKELAGFQFKAEFVPSEGFGNTENKLKITCGINPQSVSNSSGRPGIVIESGAVNIPAAPAGYMSATYRMNVDRVEIYVPVL